MKNVFRLALTYLVICQGSLAYPQSPNVHEAATSVLSQNGVTPEFAADPANQEVMAKIRRLAKEGYLPARSALLKVSDPEVTAWCLEQLRASRWFASGDAAKALGASGQLKLIALLGADLNTQETAQPTVLHTGDENFRITPVSVLATKIMRSLIVDSTEFPPAVKEWATNLEQRNDRLWENARTSMRVWWNQNEAFLRADQYGQVQPPHS